MERSLETKVLPQLIKVGLAELSEFVFLGLLIKINRMFKYPIRAANMLYNDLLKVVLHRKNCNRQDLST